MCDEARQEGEQALVRILCEGSNVFSSKWSGIFWKEFSFSHTSDGICGGSKLSGKWAAVAWEWCLPPVWIREVKQTKNQKGAGRSNQWESFLEIWSLFGGQGISEAFMLRREWVIPENPNAETLSAELPPAKCPTLPASCWGYCKTQKGLRIFFFLSHEAYLQCSTLKMANLNKLQGWSFWSWPEEGSLYFPRLNPGVLLRDLTESLGGKTSHEHTLIASKPKRDSKNDKLRGKKRSFSFGVEVVGDPGYPFRWCNI